MAIQNARGEGGARRVGGTGPKQLPGWAAQLGADPKEFEQFQNRGGARGLRVFDGSDGMRAMPMPGQTPGGRGGRGGRGGGGGQNIGPTMRAKMAARDAAGGAGPPMSTGGAPTPGPAPGAPGGGSYGGSTDSRAPTNQEMFEFTHPEMYPRGGASAPGQAGPGGPPQATMYPAPFDPSRPRMGGDAYNADPSHMPNFNTPDKQGRVGWEKQMPWQGGEGINYGGGSAGFLEGENDGQRPPWMSTGGSKTPLGGIGDGQGGGKIGEPSAPGPMSPERQKWMQGQLDSGKMPVGDAVRQLDAQRGIGGAPRSNAEIMANAGQRPTRPPAPAPQGPPGPGGVGMGASGIPMMDTAPQPMPGNPAPANPALTNAAIRTGTQGGIEAPPRGAPMPGGGMTAGGGMQGDRGGGMRGVPSPPPMPNPMMQGNPQLMAEEMRKRKMQSGGGMNRQPTGPPIFQGAA